MRVGKTAARRLVHLAGAQWRISRASRDRSPWEPSAGWFTWPAAGRNRDHRHCPSKVASPEPRPGVLSIAQVRLPRPWLRRGSLALPK